MWGEFGVLLSFWGGWRVGCEGDIMVGIWERGVLGDGGKEGDGRLALLGRIGLEVMMEKMRDHSTNRLQPPKGVGGLIMNLLLTLSMRFA